MSSSSAEMTLLNFSKRDNKTIYRIQILFVVVMVYKCIGVIAPKVCGVLYHHHGCQYWSNIGIYKSVFF